MSQPHFEASVRMKVTLPKVGTWSPPRLSKIQSLIAGVKTPRIEVFFIPLERSWNVDVQNALHESFGHLKNKLWSKEGQGVKLGVWLPTTKSQESTQSRCVQVECDTPWKALEESYNFALDFIPIGGPSQELWAPKVPGVQTRTVSRFLLGSLGTKRHSDVGPVGEHRKYYIGEGGGFPRVRAVVSKVSSCCPWLVPTPKVIQNEY